MFPCSLARTERRLNMRRLKVGDAWKDLIDEDLPSCAVDELTKDTVEKESSRFRASMRIIKGMFWTDREYEEYRSRVLGTPLP